MSSLASHVYFHILIINVCAAEGGRGGVRENACGESCHVLVCARNVISAFPVM